MSTKNKKLDTKNPTQTKVKVLYQNLGGTWYAFSQVGDDVFFGAVPVEQKANKEKTVDALLKKKNHQLIK